MRREKATGEVHVFGGKPHLALVLDAKRGGHVVEISHAAHVDPGLRHRHNYIGMAEPERLDKDDVPVGNGNHLTNEILAGKPKMHATLRQPVHDLGSRKKYHLDARQVGDGATVVARAARLGQIEPGSREERFGVGLQTALGRHCDDKRSAHEPSGNADSRSIQAAKPTAGMGFVLPRRVSNPS